MKNKRGLSTIVAVLIIILLAIAAFAIVVRVIMPLMEKNAEKIELSSKCLDVDLSVIKVLDESGGNYSVSIERSATGDPIEGYSLIFVNDANDNSVYYSIPEKVDIFYKKTIMATNLTEFAPATVSVVPYFLTKAEDKYFCGEGQMFTIPQPIPVTTDEGDGGDMPEYDKVNLLDLGNLIVAST